MNIDCQAMLCGAAMGYLDDDDNWHDFDGVEVSFLLPKELVADGISIGHVGRLTFTAEVADAEGDPSRRLRRLHLPTLRKRMVASQRVPYPRPRSHRPPRSPLPRMRPTSPARRTVMLRYRIRQHTGTRLWYVSVHHRGLWWTIANANTHAEAIASMDNHAAIFAPRGDQ